MSYASMALILLVVLAMGVGAMAWAMSRKGYTDVTLKFSKEAEDIQKLRKMLGTADWQWDRGMNCHIPCCRYQIALEGFRRCGNGPLTGDEISEGYCDEHSLIPDLFRKEREGGDA